MKITIEDTNNNAAPTAVVTNETMTMSAMPAIDAGQPPAALLQAVSTAAMVEGTDAGAPPEALVQALQGASSMTAVAGSTGTYASANYTGEITNAGAAPVG